jgi:hypothetical protein
MALTTICDRSLQARASIGADSSCETFAKNVIAGRIDNTPGRCAIFGGPWMPYVDHRQ